MANKTTDVLIGIPSTGTWMADFGMCMAHLMAYSAGNRVPDRLRINQVYGSILNRSRQMILDYGLEVGATHVLFIDTDMMFPPDMLERLLKHKGPVVAANCVVKQLPAVPTARFKEEGNPGGKPVDSWNKRGCEQVWRVGCGVMLINLEVLKDIPKPHFNTFWVPEVDSYVGEDWAFCELLEQHGHKIFVDHDLSKQVQHIGYFEYGHQHALVNANEGSKDHAEDEVQAEGEVGR